jgi:hypothetical protein
VTTSQLQLEYPDVVKVYWKALSDNFWTIVILLLALVAVVAVPFVAWDIFSALRRDYVSTHTSYPVTEHHTRGEQLTRYERFEAVKGFLIANGRSNVSRDMKLSDGPSGSSDCRHSESEIRVVTSVINPATGDPADNDVTMLFCVDNLEGTVRAADNRSRYFTTKD